MSTAHTVPIPIAPGLLRRLGPRAQQVLHLRVLLAHKARGSSQEILLVCFERVQQSQEDTNG